MGKRKRQVLTILNERYEHNRKIGSDWAKQNAQDFIEEDTPAWMSRENILATAAKEELPPYPWQGLPTLDLERLILEVTPQPLREEYDRLAASALKVRNKGLNAEAWEGWEEFWEFKNKEIMPLRHGKAFKKRWGALRGSLYWAVKALEKEGLVKSATNDDDGVRYFQITPAGRDAISDLLTDP
jgi:DNA-binding MarR family transcriptional regulator